MRCKPSRKCFLINQMIWPMGLATDKSCIVYHTRLITGFILRLQRAKDSRSALLFATTSD